MLTNRRHFLQTTTSATTAMLLSSLDVFATTQKDLKMNTGFQLKILATSWGFQGSADAFCAKVKQEGYDGIEAWWPTQQKDADELFAALKKYNLEVGFLVAGHESNYPAHLASFRKMLTAAATNKSQRPLFINCHSGKDYFSFDENKAIVEVTLELGKQTGIKICHETHRSRMLFAAPIAKTFLQKIPGLRITFDVSH